MITFFAILAICADLGHSYFPNSPLNWWVAIYSMIAGLSCIMQLIQLYDDKVVGCPTCVSIENLKPLMADLTLTLILTLIYSWI